MQSRLEIRRGVYHDSVVLMRATSRLRTLMLARDGNPEAWTDIADAQ